MPSFDGRVQGDNDNAKAKTGSYDSANPLIFGRDGKNGANDTRVYGRWQPSIPSGATVTSAYLYVVAQEARSDAFYTEVDLITQNGRDCPAFTSNPWTWTLLGSAVRWPPSGNLPAWSLDVEYQSPDITTLAQNWIDNVSDPETCWLGLVILDGDAANDEIRKVYSFSGASAKALRLVINYEVGVPPGWNDLEFASEPPVGSAWNKVLYDPDPPSAGWNKLKYKV